MEQIIFEQVSANTERPMYLIYNDPRDRNLAPQRTLSKVALTKWANDLVDEGYDVTVYSEAIL